VIAGHSGRELQPPVDLGTHDLAVGGRVIEAAQQRALQVRPGAHQPLDLGVERFGAPAADDLPLVDRAGAEDRGDVVERQPGVRYRRWPDRRASAGSSPRRS
jgi:hypothetical protein